MCRETSWRADVMQRGKKFKKKKEDGVQSRATQQRSLKREGTKIKERRYCKRHLPDMICNKKMKSVKVIPLERCHKMLF